jgi:hypothetical protein
LAFRRNLLCVAPFGGVAFFWFAHAQKAATDAERFVGASRALNRALTHGDAAATVWLEQVSDAEYNGR